MTLSLPRSIVSRIITDQIIRASTSVAANYRAACRAKSDSDFLFKIKIVEEEADETLFWLEIIVLLELIRRKRLESLIKEAEELLKIFSASAITARNKARKKFGTQTIVNRKSKIENYNQ